MCSHKPDLLIPFSLPLDNSFHLHRWQSGFELAGSSTAWTNYGLGHVVYLEETASSELVVRALLPDTSWGPETIPWAFVCSQGLP